MRAALTAVAVAALAGCVALPTSGPVTAGDGEVREPEGIVVLAQGPQADAGPAEIVEGFLLAGAAEVTGDFAVAREFLVGQAREEWDPTAGAVVATTRQFEVTGDAQVNVEVSVEGKLDPGGRFTETSADARESLRFELVEDADGHWRIAHAPDGLLLTPANLDQQYRPVKLWFLTPDADMLVPEVRWFSQRSLQTAVVKALLAGPSPWLRDSVRTAVPAGVELEPEAVLLEGGVAEVSLQPAQAVQEADRGLLLAQLEASLRPLGVASVQVRAGGVVLRSGAQTLPTAPPRGELEVLTGGRVVTLTDGQVTPVEDLAPVDGAAPQALAHGAGGVHVALADPGTLVTVAAPGQVREVLASGTALAAPSVDRHGWVWTARSPTAAPLVAARPGGPVVDVTGDWLAGRTVQALRVSPDGTRVAVVSAGADGVTLDVAGVVRDEAGAPLRLGQQPVRVGAQAVPTTSVVWVDEVTLAVLAEDEAGTVPVLVPLSASSSPLPAVAGAVALAAERGDRTLHVVTSEGELLRYDGRTWVAVPGVAGVTGAAFPG
ncbi:hypothetical protein GC089_06215 [Cellulomonas sp. JZ18]|nr:hypothetical protein GC089_06215 [Cellulomonas sp. JZ18]